MNIPTLLITRNSDKLIVSYNMSRTQKYQFGQTVYRHLKRKILQRNLNLHTIININIGTILNVNITYNHTSEYLQLTLLKHKLRQKYRASISKVCY